ncbi:hypothetical protein [Vibrio sp. WXL210]|uniref:hypothetical protein n=1 Tax=Vibrio sp. WXL210 TaxID=3450709 RepID=UPI003EC73BA6
MNKTLVSLLVASSTLLVGCNETEYNDILIPVDSDVRGFWTMLADTECEQGEYCYLDYSEYNNKLYAIDSGDRKLTHDEVLLAEHRVKGRLDSAVYLETYQLDDGGIAEPPRLQTESDSDFESRPLSDEFTIHVRATGEPGSILSLWNDNELALHLEVLDGVLMATFDNHGKKLFTSIKPAAFQEIQLVSDGETVTLTNNCVEVGQFERTAGLPILSDSPLRLTAFEMRGGYTEATQFTGALDVIRISDRVEQSIFCQ